MGNLFAGMMVGGWVWGSLADSVGRRWCLITALAVNAVFGLASAFAETFGYAAQLMGERELRQFVSFVQRFAGVSILVRIWCGRIHSSRVHLLL